MSADMPILLAIDFGTQRIGLAISRGTLAEPLKIIESGATAIPEIKKITAEENVEKIIVGISENEMAMKTHQFVLELQKEISLPVEFTDETLSSYTVHQKMKSAPKSKRGKHIDHLAAAEFLQEYLDFAE